MEARISCFLSTTLIPVCKNVVWSIRLVGHSFNHHAVDGFFIKTPVDSLNLNIVFRGIMFKEMSKLFGGFHEAFVGQ